MKLPKLSQLFPATGAGAPVQPDVEDGRRVQPGPQKKRSESEQLADLSKQFGLPILDAIPDDDLDTELVRRVPIHYLKRNLVFPYKEEDGLLRLAVRDPLNLEILDDLRLLFGKERIELALASSAEIVSAINKAFDQAEESAEEIIQDLDEDQDDGNVLADLDDAGDLLDETSDAPIIKLVNHIFSQAVKDRASDIHIEPFKKNLLVRFRLDGVLYTIHDLPARLHAPIISRIKILANLNIAEKRLPQDGRIELKIGNRLVDIRVSCLPTSFGERVVLRLLEKGGMLLGLEDIGLSPTCLKEMLRLIHLPNGILLVTGPTGSGKTTSLYAALNYINSPDKNILTIEDPVEYQLNGIGQMQVNQKIGLTFAAGLRSILRQDPDVILIGEIRDLETADIAIQSSLTGHLVLSTLHTNDAPSAVTRLIDMGIEPFLVSSTVQAIIAQRLVRLLCPKCKQPIRPDDPRLAELGITKEELARGHVYEPKGCPECLDTGYKGRTGIYEFLRMTEGLKTMVLKTSDSVQLREAAIQDGGMETLRQDGIRRVLMGETSLEEVLRVTSA